MTDRETSGESEQEYLPADGKPADDKKLRRRYRWQESYKLTPERQARICAFLRAGNYVETAAVCAGIDKTTLYTWLRHGSSGKAQEYVEFYNAVMEAIAQAEALAINTITQAGQSDWTALAWRLERMAPSKFGRVARHQATPTWHDGSPPASGNVDRDDLRNQILAAASALPAPGRPDSTIEG